MHGAIITRGPQDWQIIQQENGFGKIEIEGTFVPLLLEGREKMKHEVYAIIVDESTYDDLILWKKCEYVNGKWKHTFLKF